MSNDPYLVASINIGRCLEQKQHRLFMTIASSSPQRSLNTLPHIPSNGRTKKAGKKLNGRL
jgi:hypothetical protein